MAAQQTDGELGALWLYVRENRAEGLEKKLGDSLGTYAVISDRREQYVNAIGLSQLILTWSCLEKLEHLLGKG